MDQAPEEEEVEGVEEEGVEEEGVEPEEGEDLEEDEAEEAGEEPAVEPEGPTGPAETSEPTEEPPTPAEPALAPVDPVQAAIEKRANELKISGIVRPEKLVSMLRESIEEIVGVKAAVAYHVGASFKDGEIKFQVARLGPHLLARLTADMDSAELDIAYRKTTAGGWQIAVGLTASTSFDAPAGSEITASFAVTVSR